MERRDLYQDDLTEERQPSPAARADVADTLCLDPNISTWGHDGDRAAADEIGIGRDESAEDELND